MKYCTICEKTVTSKAEYYNDYMKYSDGQCSSCGNHYLLSHRETSLVLKSKGDIMLVSQNSYLQEVIELGKRQLDYKDGQINSYSSQLSHAQRQLDVAYNDLTKSQNKYEELGGKFNDLQREKLIKDFLLDKKISVEDVQELCIKCEKIAELRIKREELYQREFEARQEVSNN